MNSLMIIDDEQIIIDELICAMSFEDMGIKLIDIASNGMVGLEKISKYRPDIIICDINMPVMSGIEMLEKVKEIVEYKPQIIMLTALDEFSYAQKAISLNVLDYLVKPCTPFDLSKVLEKAKKMCKREERYELNEDELADNAKSVFIENVIFCNRYSEEEMQEQQNKWGVKLDGRYYKIIYVRISDSINITVNERNILKKQIIDYFSSAFQNIYSTVFNSDGVYFLLSTNDLEQERTEEKCRHIVSELSGYNVYISVSEAGKCLDDAGDLLKQVQFCSRFAFCFDKSAVLVYDEISDYIKDAFARNIFAEYEKNLNDIIDTKQNPWDEYVLALNNISNRFKYYDPEYIKNVVYRTMTKLINDFYDVENSNELEKKSTMWIDISEKEFFYEIARYCEKIVDEIKDNVKANVFERQSLLAEKVKKYIKSNYMKHITIESVSKEFHVSQSSLRRLFVNTNGISFNDFLMDFRMNKAKELLMCEKYKIYEVAQMVGYRDVPTFRKTFGKFFGMTPSEFVNNGK